MPAFQMTAKSMKHQFCRTQFVSVQAYQSQLLYNDSNTITKMKMYEIYLQGRDDFYFDSSEMQELQGSPELSLKSAHSRTKLSFH